MHHRAVVKLGTHDNLGYRIQCTCGTGGDFGSKEEAMSWMTANHFRYLQGINTAEIVDETPKTETTPVPDEPETPVEPTPSEEPEEPEGHEEGEEATEKPKPRPKKAKSA